MSHQPQEERRKFQRVSTYLPVRLRLEYSGRYMETLAKDVSQGGLRCLVEGQPTINDRVVLEVPLYKEVLPIEAHARVAWVQPAAAKDHSVVGISFDALGQPDSQVLVDYLGQLELHS